MKRLLVLVLLLALSAPSAQAFDACGLLKGAQIRAVQGESLQRVDRSTGNLGQLVATQCYFALTTPVNSVSLAVMQAGHGASARAVTLYWEETFGHGAKDDDDRDHDRKTGRRPAEDEEEAHANPPTPVRGLGAPAYWSGSAVGGSLYALHRNRILRISVGGRGGPAEKQKRCRRLAILAMRHL